jgi:hypothetical protein
MSVRNLDTGEIMSVEHLASVYAGDMGEIYREIGEM